MEELTMLTQQGATADLLCELIIEPFSEATEWVTDSTSDTVGVKKKLVAS